MVSDPRAKEALAFWFADTLVKALGRDSCEEEVRCLAEGGDRF